jgi:pyridoxamine 5'-phosphate oxidase-like protein
VPGAFARELPAERPRTPDVSYGVPADGGVFVGWGECVERLRTAEAYWLATTGPKGSPHVVPVWGVNALAVPARIGVPPPTANMIDFPRRIGGG